MNSRRWFRFLFFVPTAVFLSFVFQSESAVAVIGGMRVGSEDPLFDRVVRINLVAQVRPVDPSRTDLERTAQIGVCSGPIVGDREILTSAHCSRLPKLSEIALQTGLNKSDLANEAVTQVSALGCLVIEGAIGSPTRVRGAIPPVHCGEFIVSPDYRPNQSQSRLQRAQHNLAVLQMADDFRFPEGMGRFQLRQMETDENSESLIVSVAGFGLQSLSPYPRRRGELRWARMRLEGPDSRVIRPLQSQDLQTFSLLASPPEPSIDGAAAPGDSGGPVFVRDGEDFVLLGLIQGGTMFAEDFEVGAELRDYEAYFTSVLDPRNWDWLSAILTPSSARP